MKNKKDIVIVILSFMIIILGCAVGYLVYKDSNLSLEIDKLKTQANKSEEEKNNLQNSYDSLSSSYTALENNSKDLKFAFMKNREGTYSVDKLKELDLEGIDKIMISTHPDDEMFWGGGELIKEDYLVVCVTCGMDENRLEEFQKSMKMTNDKYIALSYPRPVDKSLNREFNWKAAGYLTQDLENILNLKKWDKIVTHNPSGEYGHKYHILTSQIVTSLVKDKSKLYYFEKYFKKEEEDQIAKTLDDDIYNKKVAIINANYKSQWKSAEIHSHMFKNETFVKYADWK